jgi:Domain of unknown function (DUF4157)
MLAREPEQQPADTSVRRRNGHSDTSAAPAGVAGSPVVADLLALQRLAGNSTVTGLVEVQRSAVHEALRSVGRPLEAAARADMEARLGADFSDVRVHTDGMAHRAAESVGAHAFTSGSHVVFQRGRYDTGSVAGRRMLAHELAHVVQQRRGPVAGTETADGISVSDPGDFFERQAEAIAAYAVREAPTGAPPDAQPGMHEETTSGQKPVQHRGDPSTPVQRWAFVPDDFVDGATAVVDPNDPALDGNMKALASDTLVHDYEDMVEFKEHAAGSTDYLGNLPGPASQGTWVRFSPTGTNVLGESHTQVTLDQVVAAVGSTNFIYEPFSVDDMPAGTRMRTAYEKDNAARFEKMGIADEPDKRQYGAESLFPKMGFALNDLLPYLADGADLGDISPPNYLGRPLQRYLKMAWAHGKDIADELGAAATPPPPAQAHLATVVGQTNGKLNKFIKGLSVEGYLGEALGTRAGAKLIAPLRQFCEAFVAAMMDRAATNNDLTGPPAQALTAMTQTHGEGAVFGEWRNLHISQALRAAAGRGVRYAGMGALHLQYLTTQGLLPNNTHSYNMTGQHIIQFEQRTAVLTNMANSPGA